MNQIVKQEWVEALRSGDYKQGKAVLQSNTGHCCLGVLCDIYAKHFPDKGKWGTPIPRDFNNSSDVHHIPFIVDNDLSGGVLPVAVAKWAEMPDNGYYNDNPSINPYINGTTLSDHNDGGKTFLEIADLIEANL